ncbi:Rieske (2Fe-2S) protein [Halorientalis litorea]|jgi:nitrite reductase/ring-hydroxylating ferredoxin subunit|uniref:Rieske (2Fe-2S) protein n=1 Tax=Halorientalis litorea TaxID=2931977 RepID=UPI001FF5FDC2|nr:Rieske 2Fe-2S domain-containing protein [Halorientalis litorea]
MDEGSRVVSVNEVPEDSTFLFRVQENGIDEQQEAILVSLADGVACWLNYCQHFTHIKLDKGSGAEMRDGELICTNHGAYFEEESGRCTYGPCEGAYLQEVAVTVSDGAVYLTDDEYTFAGVGPIETDDVDLGSKSNYEF